MIIPLRIDGFVEGVRRYHDGGGGSSQPTNQTISNVSIPEYAKPYVEGLLGKTDALTSQNPYQTYGGQRVAGLAGLQNQAAGGAGSVNVGQNYGQATQLAGQAGIAGLQQGANYDPTQTQFGMAQAQQYMDPYQQSVTDINSREAMRQAGIQNTQLQGQAAGAGAFGGSRHGVVEAENNRNLQTQLGDIQNKGLSAAYQNAQQQFNADQQRMVGDKQFGANLGQQGLQTALGASQQLGSLGQQGYTMQNTSGALQQANQQQGLDTAYQDFLNQQNYPYKQLGFMSDMLRGLPLSQSSQSFYGQAPSTGSQLAGLGIAGLGLASK